MSTKNLHNRLIQLEQVVSPKTNVLMVFVKEDDTSCEAAYRRAAKNMGDRLAENYTIFSFNLYQKPKTEEEAARIKAQAATA
jgi:hypothetical protein